MVWLPGEAFKPPNAKGVILKRIKWNKDVIMAEKQNKTAASEKMGVELVASGGGTGSLLLSLIADLRKIIEQGRREAYAAVSQVMISTYWNIGKRIVEEEQGGADYAKYGQYLLRDLGEQLCAEYGRGYTKRRLEEYRLFYLSFRNIEIAQTRLRNLTWSHFRIIMREPAPEGRAWYVREAAEQMWSTRTLERNVTTQYYGRLLASQRAKSETPQLVGNEAAENPLDYLRNPVIAEFMGFRQDRKFSESQLEDALIGNLEKFIMELGRGFAFVDRQQHVTTDTEDFYIDLVFYNFKLKRFVIFELKTHKLTHQDVGQLDMYVRMYDDLFKGADDNPTIGVLLCTDTDNTIARYSVLHENEQLFAAKYMAYLPTEEELRHEIEQQKRFFLEQHPEKKL